MITTGDNATRQVTTWLTENRAVQSLRMNGIWAHLPATARNPAAPLQPGESAKTVGGRWVHGPRIGGAR